MDIIITGFEGVESLAPDETLPGTLTLTVLNEAEQNSQYPFLVGFGFSELPYI